MIISLASREYAFVKTIFDGFRFSWQSGMGDFPFDFDKAENPHLYLAWMALFLSLILNMIVLFNLLISIVSETFEHVKTNRVEFEFH